MLIKGKILFISFITVGQCVKISEGKKRVVRESNLEEVALKLVLDLDGGLPRPPRLGNWPHSSLLSLALSIVQGRVNVG